MSQNLEMVRAVYSGISQRQVAKSYKISRNTLALRKRQITDVLTDLIVV